MNDLVIQKPSLNSQLGILKNGHLWGLGLLYFTYYGSFIGYAAAFAMLSTIQFPKVEILYFAFLGPFLGALARSLGGILADRLGGALVTAANFILMAVLILMLTFTLPDNNGGLFILFFQYIYDVVYYCRFWQWFNLPNDRAGISQNQRCSN